MPNGHNGHGIVSHASPLYTCTSIYTSASGLRGHDRVVGRGGLGLGVHIGLLHGLIVVAVLGVLVEDALRGSPLVHHSDYNCNER